MWVSPQRRTRCIQTFEMSLYLQHSGWWYHGRNDKCHSGMEIEVLQLTVTAVHDMQSEQCVPIRDTASSTALCYYSFKLPWKLQSMFFFFNLKKARFKGLMNNAHCVWPQVLSWSTQCTWLTYSLEEVTKNEEDKNLSFTYLHTKNHSARKITSFTDSSNFSQHSTSCCTVIFRVCMTVTLLGAIFLLPLTMCFLRPQIFL